MRSQLYIKMLLSVVIITAIVQLLWERQIYTETGTTAPAYMVWRGQASCWIRQFPLWYEVPECHQYTPGDVLAVTFAEPSSQRSQSGHQQSSRREDASLVKSEHITWLEGFSFVSAEVVEVTQFHPKPFSGLWWLSSLEKISHPVRNHVLSAFNWMSDPYRSIAQKLLVGSFVQLPDGENQAVQELGLSHMFAVSGFHVSLLFAVVSSVIVLKNRTISIVAACLATVLAVLAAGPVASVCRAGMMMCLAQFAKYQGRKPDNLAILQTTTMVSLVINPEWLWDISWQLSYAALWILVLIKPAFEHIVSRPNYNSNDVLSLDQLCNKKCKEPIINQILATFKRTLRAPLEAGYTSGVIVFWMMPFVVWHFGTATVAGVVVLFFSWWLFPLVFSSLVMWLLIWTLSKWGLIYHSIINLSSVLLITIPLESLMIVLDLFRPLQSTTIDVSQYREELVVVYVLLLCVVLFLDRRTAYAPFRSSRNNPMMTAFYGLY